MNSNKDNTWDVYVENFNLLSDEMFKASIDIQLLIDTLISYTNYMESI